MRRNTVSFSLKNDMAELDALRRHLGEFARTQRLSKKILMAITLSIEEHFANIVSYGFQDDRDHRIDITISRREEKRCTIRIIDDGIPYDPTESAMPELDRPLPEREEGGLGIHLARHFMDTLEYHRLGDTNVLEMTKYIP